MAKYVFSKRAGVMNIKVEGFFKPEDGMAYLSEFDKQIKTINCADTVLEFDATGLQTSSADAVPVLENCIKLYMDKGFKEVVVITNEKNVVVKMQLNRLKAKFNYDKMTIK